MLVRRRRKECLSAGGGKNACPPIRRKKCLFAEGGKIDNP